MVAGTSLGQLTYASFYLGPLSFGYLSLPENNAIIQYLPVIQHPFHSLDPIHLFWFLTAFTFLGAMQVHGAVKVIYGPEGPAKRPKHNTVQIRHSLAFALGVDAEEIPVTPIRLATSNIAKEWLRDINQGRTRVRRGLRELGEIGLMVTRGKYLRFAYFIPMGVHRFLSRIAFLAIAATLYFGASGYAGFVLFAGLFVLHFRNWVWAPFPPVFNSDALDDRFNPEYVVHDPDREEPRPRIRSR